MRKIQVRLATDKDAQIIYNLILHSSDETNFLALDSAERLEEGFSKESVENLINGNLNRMFICFFEDIPIGVLGIHYMQRKRFKHRASIGINVLKKYWGLGAGKALLSKAIEHFNDDKELTKLELEVRSDNNRAIKLYEKFGFKIEGEISQYFHINGISYSGYIMGIEK